jgi:hypothetical protein
VLLYFIVRVEVVEIQIGFEFKLICNLQNRIEKEKEFEFSTADRSNWSIEKLEGSSSVNFQPHIV